METWKEDRPHKHRRGKHSTYIDRRDKHTEGERERDMIACNREKRGETASPGG